MASTIGYILIVFLTILMIVLIYTGVIACTYTGKFIRNDHNKSPLNCKGIRPPSPSQLKEKAKNEKNSHEIKSMEPTAFAAFSMASLGQKPSPQPQNNDKS